MNDRDANSDALAMLLSPFFALIGLMVYDKNVIAGRGLIITALCMFFPYPVACFRAWWRATAPRRQRRREESQLLRDAKEQHRRERERERAIARAEAQTRYEEDARQRLARKTVRAAREEAESFYRQNEELIAELCPPALFLANLETAIPFDASSGDAWSGARELIAGLQPIVEEGRRRRNAADVRRRERERQVAAINRKIKRLEGEIADLASSSGEPGITEPEIWTLKREIRELEHEREAMFDDGRLL